LTVIGRRGLFLALAAPLTASALGGCVYSSESTTERAVSPTVIVAEPPAAQPSEKVVVPRPSDTIVVTQPSDRVISYPEGSYKLSGDATRGYYWLWIPAGSTAAAPPAPPTLPRVVQSEAPVLAARPERVISYPQGRYDLYGNASTGYYWVWIPTGARPPAPPPPPF
jgi:hypothetical protein